MNIDMHIHVVGSGRDIEKVDEDVFFDPSDNQEWFTRVLYWWLEKDMKRLGSDVNHDGRVSTREYLDLVYGLVMDSKEIDGVVLLALDAVFSPATGELQTKETDLWVSNRFLAREAARLNREARLEADPSKRAKRFFFGASVSPNRLDWKEELAFVVERTEAVLLKLIPSVQHVDMMDRRHREFFNAVAMSGMPMLCHVGPEYSFPEGFRNRKLDSFRRLELALAHNVTVIAAHCATPVFPLLDNDDTDQFIKFMEESNDNGSIQLLADTSALSLSTRIPLVARILDRIPPEWLVHGSDFPIPIDGWTHVPWLTHDVKLSEYLRILKTRNPLDRDVAIKRAMGFDDSALGNAGDVLRTRLSTQ